MRPRPSCLGRKACPRRPARRGRGFRPAHRRQARRGPGQPRAPSGPRPRPGPAGWDGGIGGVPVGRCRPVEVSSADGVSGAQRVPDRQLHPALAACQRPALSSRTAYIPHTWPGRAPGHVTARVDYSAGDRHAVEVTTTPAGHHTVNTAYRRQIKGSLEL